jgi:hypothetical protein
LMLPIDAPMGVVAAKRSGCRRVRWRGAVTTP